MPKQQLFSISSIQLAILKSEPPQLSVIVHGLATSTGWTDPELMPLEKELSKDGILDLDFIAEPPEGPALSVMTPVTAYLVWEDDVDRLIGVKVYSRANDQIQLLSSQAMPEFQSASSAPYAGHVTTLAIGEEIDPPTTLAIGEEINPPTTLAIGEEGPNPKPYFGETDPRADDPIPPFPYPYPYPFPPYPFPPPRPGPFPPWPQFGPTNPYGRR